MSLNIALTGINASNTEISVVSDNIANANTTGFKKSRAEFGDLVDSMSRDGNGLGVRLQGLTQTFTQGSIEDTGRTFDMAVTGEGFFVLDNGGQTTYSRAGNFYTDDSGYIVNNSSRNVQGFSVEVQNAKATGEVTYDVALDSTASVPTNAFDPEDRSSYNYMTSLSVFDSGGISHDLKTYFRNTAAQTWDVYYVLDDLPPRQALDAANAAISLVFDIPANGGALLTGGDQTLTFTPADLGSTLVGNPPAPVESLSITLDLNDMTEGTEFAIASLSQDGAVATRTLRNDGDVDLVNLKVDSSNMAPRITSEAMLGLNLSALEKESRPTTQATFDMTLDGVQTASTAAFDPTDSTSYDYSTSIQVYDSKGINHTLETYFVWASATTYDIYHTLDRNTTYPTYSFQPAAADTWTLSDVDVPTGGATTSLTFTTAQLGTGADDLTIDLDYTNLKLGSSNIVNSLVANTQSADPDSIDSTDSSSYNYSTAMTVYDSVGMDHTMNLFFRKIADNNWSVFYQFSSLGSIAEKVGTLTFDSRGILMRATDKDGFTDELNPLTLDVIGIQFGQGTARQNIALDFSDTNQFDSISITNSLSQDGYTSGVMTGVEPDDSGNIIASYTNGQTQIMGQVALARFANVQGLKRIGDNNWIQTSESGLALNSAPGIGMMGKLITGALEGSNVELTKELVDMISAQRSFQANAQVINTTGTLYQAILNIR